MKYLFTLILTLLISSCVTDSRVESKKTATCILGGGNSNGYDDVLVEIAPYMSPCIGATQTQCMVISDNCGQQQLFYDPISGFNFEWGKKKSIVVRSTKLNTPPLADGSSIVYTMLKEVKSEIVDSFDFEIQIHKGTEIKVAPDSIKIEGYTKKIFRINQDQIIETDSGLSKNEVKMLLVYKNSNLNLINTVKLLILPD